MNLDEALSDLLPGGRTGDLEADLQAAVTEVWRRRHRNTELGAAVIAALLGQQSWTYGRIQREIGIPKATAHRWSAAPGDAPGDEPAAGTEPPA